LKRRFRVFYRLVGAMALTVGIWIAWVIGLPLAFATKRPGRWRNLCIHAWGRALMIVLGVRVERRGSPPTGGFLLVANHLGYLDIPVIASQVPVVFVSKAEVAHWPVIGWFARSVGILFVDRADKRALPKVAADIERELRGGNGVVLFPEGTSSKGAEVLTFRPSLLDPAARLGIPVSCAALSYRTPEGCTPASRSVCWWGDMTFGGHAIGLLGLPRIDAVVSFGDTPVVDADRKSLAQRLWNAVQVRFEPVS
jgi:1-acyl-sn-glycerol-3-phosphate acyltransferase